MRDLTEARENTGHAVRRLRVALRGTGLLHARHTGADALRRLGDVLVGWAGDVRTALYAEAEMVERSGGMADSTHATAKDDHHG